MIRRQELEWYLQGGADAVRKNREAESSGTSSTATLLPEMKREEAARRPEAEADSAVSRRARTKHRKLNRGTSLLLPNDDG
jgi:hypothetical protein